MNRPKRSAAVTARELIRKGITARYVDEQGLSCLEPEEEDILDQRLMEECDIIGGEYDDDDFGTPDSTNEASSSSVTYLSYRDADEDPDIHAFQPRRPPGPQLVRGGGRGDKSLTRAIDFFTLYFTEEIMEIIQDNSNTYAWLHILEKPTYSLYDGSWSNISEQELRNFIGLIIYMGFVCMPDIASYWATRPLYDGGWARRFMSRNMFKAMLAFVHVSDPGNDDPADKLCKLHPLLGHMKSHCAELLQPSTCIAIDERMVKSKGRSGIPQYMPKKPVRFGYKLWCVCDSRTGYTLDFDIYTGKRQQPGMFGLAFDVVMKLMEGYLNQGYRLYVDNFYTSAQLLKTLHENGVGVCGTTLSTRKQFPEALKDKTWPRKAKRGEMRWVRQGAIVYVQWMDTRVVQICSTLHKGSDFTFVQRRLKDPKGNYRPVMVRKPQAIHDYNQEMGAVDLADQLIQPYNTLMKCHRWWKTLFLHLIDVAVVNSFILFKLHREMYPDNPQLQRPQGFSQLAYREELVKQLANIEEDEVVPLAVCNNRTVLASTFHTDHVPEHDNRRQNCKLCYITEKLKRRTQWVCTHEHCQVPLCLNAERNCFKLWHASSFDRYREHVLASIRRIHHESEL